VGDGRFDVRRLAAASSFKKENLRAIVQKLRVFHAPSKTIEKPFVARIHR
jgi:hypothetical protein